MPTTLLAAATQKRDWYKAAQAKAQTDLAAAQTSLTVANAPLAQDLATRQALQAAMVVDRAALSTTTIPSDVSALLVKLSTEIIADRRLQGKLLDDRAAVAAAQEAADFSQARLARATADLADAAAALVDVTADSKRRDGWRQAITQTPLSTIATDAGNILANTGSTLLKDATAKLTTAPHNLPAALLEIAQERYDVCEARLASANAAITTAETQLGASAAADGGKAGASQKAGVDFTHAAQAFGLFVATAKQRFDRAVAALTTLANLGAQTYVLSDPQAQAINDAGVATRGTAAEGKEKAYDDQLKIVDGATTALADATLTAQAVDPNADVSGNGAVTAAAATLTTAQGKLAGLALASADRDALAAWQVIVPDDAWRMILGFVDAQSVLKELSASNAGNLQAAMDTAEGLYGDAELAAWQSARSGDFLQDAIVRRQEAVTNVRADFDDRLLSATRGDAS